MAKTTLIGIILESLGILADKLRFRVRRPSRSREAVRRLHSVPTRPVKESKNDR